MNLSELAAQYGGKPIEKEQSNDLAAQFGGKPIEKTNSLAEQFGGVPIKKVEPEAKPEPRPEDQSIFRQVADVPLQGTKGIVTGVRMIADAFGAGSDTSKLLKSGEEYLGELMSAQSKQDSKEISRIMKEAEDKGILDQVVAGVKALSIAPVDTIVNALGTSAPAIIGGLAATFGGAPALAVAGVGAGIGATMGAGTVKGTIYDAVKEELSKTDMPKEQIEARAKLAQDYNGKNLDMILTGAAIGTLGATTGVEPALARGLSKGIVSKAAQKEIVKEVTEKETADIAKQGIKKYAAKQGATEFATEAGQAGQEQVAENLALQREGYDVPLMRGVVSNAVLEGLAGFGMGAGVGTYTAYQAKQQVSNLDTGSQEVIKDTIKDIAKKDLQTKGVVATDDELDILINDVLKNPPKKEAKNVEGEPSRVDAGTDKSGIPVSEEQPGQGATTGVGTTTTTDVGGTGQVSTGTGNRESNEPSALENQQEADRIKDVEARRDELANAWQAYNAPEGVPGSNVTEAETTAEEDLKTLKKLDVRRKTVETKLRKTEVGSETEKKLKEQLQKIDDEWSTYEAEAEPKRQKRIEALTNLPKDVVEETPTETEQVDLQAELNQELGQEEPAKQVSEGEKNLRAVSNTPELTALPQELQDNPAVQNYHKVFNDWVIGKDSGMDPEYIDEIRKEVVKARQALPQEHPAAIKAVAVETKKKGRPSKEDAAKAKELKDIQQQIKELQKQLTWMPEDGRVRIRESITELTKQARKLMPKDIKLSEAGMDEDVSGNIHPTVYDAIQKNDIKGVLNAIFKTSRDYTRSLAGRLANLNLNTEIFFNRQEELLSEFVSRVSPQLTRLENYLESTYPEAAVYVDQTFMDSPILRTAEAYKFLKSQKSISFAGLEQELDAVISAYEQAASAYNARGFYLGGNINTISLNTNIAYHSGTTTNHVLLHEIIHAATQWAINNRDQLTREQRYALDDLTALFNYAKERSKYQTEYAFTDLDEFVAEAFSNKKFQKFLGELEYEMAGPKTVWSRFMQVIGKLLGTQNVLFHTLASTEMLFSARTDSLNSGLTISPMGRPRKNAPKTPKPVATTKVNTKENFANAIIDDQIKGRVTWKDLNKQNLISWLSSLKDQYRKYLLGGFTLDQLTDMVGEAIPYFRTYNAEKDAMLNTRNKIINESEGTVASWSNLQSKDPAKAKQLDTAMIEATFAKVDPDPQGAGHNAKALKNTKAGKQAQAAWDAMVAGPNGAEAVKIYREVRAFYERRMDEYIRIVLKRLALSMKGKELSNDEIKKAIEDRYATLTEDTIKPYFPIKRFGEFWLQIGTGTNKIFMQFEDAASRNMAINSEVNRIAREKMAANAAVTREQAVEEAKGELKAGNSFSTQFNAKLADARHLDDIRGLINDTTADIQTKTDPDKVESLRKNLIDGFDQWYLEMMPTQSIRKMFIHRKNIAGLSGDMLRAFAESRQRIAYQRSRFEHLPQLFQNVDLANDALKFMPLEEQTKWRDYVRELELNLKTAVLEPPKQSKITTTATQLGFLYYLTSPASAIVNMMAVPGIYTPAAAPKYGMSNVVTSLAKYNRLLFATAEGKKTLTDEKTGRFTLFPSLARSNLADITSVADKVDLPTGKTLADVYDAGVRLLVIDTTLAHDNAALAETSSNAYTGRWQKGMYYASLPFHAAEKYNRETTFMATFDMAYRKYLDKGYTKEKAYDAAVSDARDLVQGTMFNYETTNKPRYFRGDKRNIILQFKQYPQHMSVLLWRTFEKAWISDIESEIERARVQIKNAPEAEQKEKLDALRADLEQQRKESRQQFTGMLGMSFITAGISGLPMYFIFVGVAKAMNAIFGDDDDFDVDAWFKNWCDTTFGGVAGHAINRGFLTAATGVNFANRMSTNLTDMWFPQVTPSNDPVIYAKNMLVSLLGPTVSTFLKIPEAWKKYNEGNTQRAVEALMPSAIKNVMVGTRYLIEGEAKNLSGATIVDEVNSAQALSQMLGFAPEEIALAQKKAFDIKNAAVKIDAARTNLLNGFFIAVDRGDEDMLIKAIDKVQKFNERYPTYPIQADDIRNSLKKHYQDRAKANMHGGVSINKKLYPILEEIYK